MATATAPVAPLIPFTAAAHEQTAQVGQWIFTPGASQTIFTPQAFDIPAGGFIRAVVFEISWVNGTTGTLTADAAAIPSTILDQIQIKDVNGAPLYGPLTGFQAGLTNVTGGYRPRSGDALGTQIQNFTANSGTTLLRIPVEIDSTNGLGALPNQLSNATYQISAVGNPTATFGTGYGVTPTFTINVSAEYWTQPTQADERGRPQEQNPPGVGTTQNWTVNRRPISVGGNQSQVLRVGNVIRQIVCIARDNSGVRTNAVMPNNAILYLDGTQLRNDTQFKLRADVLERMFPNATMPTGVFVYDFSHFGEAGLVGNDAWGAGWLPTSQGTRLEIQGTSAAAGTLDILVNDILPAEIRATERYDQRNAGTFQPKV